MLTGKEIKRQVELGNMVIEPFNEKQVNTNSYNLKLDSKLKIYRKTEPLLEWYKSKEERRRFLFVGQLNYGDRPIIEPLDMKINEETIDLEIPPEGLVLFPEILYLACTIEFAGSDKHVPALHGRSSVGRLGLFVHVTAGFGDVGFSGVGQEAQWTLEVVTVHPIRVYAGTEVCQICFVSPEQNESLGKLESYKGKYTSQRGPKSSGLWKDFL